MPRPTLLCLLFGGVGAHCSLPPPSSPCGFTLLIPEGPRVLHSSHSDLGPSSVTYYLRPPLLLHQSTQRALPVRGEDEETRFTP